MSAPTGASHASHASGAGASHRSICPSVRRVHPPTSSACCLFTARCVPQYPHSGETHWTTAAGIAPLGRLHCEAWPLLPNTLEVSHERQNAPTRHGRVNQAIDLCTKGCRDDRTRMISWYGRTRRPFRCLARRTRLTSSIMRSLNHNVTPLR